MQKKWANNQGQIIIRMKYYVLIWIHAISKLLSPTINTILKKNIPVYKPPSGQEEDGKKLCLFQKFCYGKDNKKNLMEKPLKCLVMAAALNRISFINSYLILNSSIRALQEGYNHFKDTALTISNIYYAIFL